MINPESDETAPANSTTAASVLLDLMRGLAAVVVLVSHWKDLLFVPWSQSIHRSLPYKLFYAVTGGGHQAVTVFFVLSGYLITASILRSHKANRWSWAVYLERRFARLWTVLLPALLLVVFFDTVGVHHAHSAPLYFGEHSDGMLTDAVAHLNFKTFFANALFLQGIATPPLGSDGALWSLSYEFWYYILFPLALAALLSGAPLGKRALNAILALAVALLIGRDILLLFPVWLMGSALNYLPRGRPRPWLTLTATVLYLPLIFARNAAHPAAFQYILGLATMGLIWLILSHTGHLRETLPVRASRTLAQFSYTLYLVHSPLLVLIAGSWIGANLQQVSPSMVLQASPLLAIALAFAYAVAWCTEFRTDIVRRWLSTLRGRFTRSSAAGA